MKKLLLVALLLLGTLLGSVCLSQDTDFTLRVIAPQSPPLPLQGTWQISKLLNHESSDATLQAANNWLGRKIYITGDRVLLGQYLLEAPQYQVKRVAANDYLHSQKQAFPPNFHFARDELEVITLADDHRFFCELVQETSDELILNLFSQSFRVKKLADTVDEGEFEAKQKTSTVDVAAFPNNSGIPTGILLGLRTSDLEQQKNNYRTLWLA